MIQIALFCEAGLYDKVQGNNIGLRVWYGLCVDYCDVMSYIDCVWEYYVVSYAFDIFFGYSPLSVVVVVPPTMIILVWK